MLPTPRHLALNYIRGKFIFDNLFFIFSKVSTTLPENILKTDRIAYRPQLDRFFLMCFTLNFCCCGVRFRFKFAFFSDLF